MTIKEDPMFTEEETRLIRQRQAQRSRVMAALLIGLCVLFFGITVVKIGFLS
jgi:hypothetical protein